MDDAIVEATLPELDATLQAMVQVQRLTGMRPQEICGLKPGQIDRSADVWIYTPGRHKTEHHGKSGVIPLGPRAQEVLLPKQLRHAAGTAIRAKFGLEAAQVILGRSRADVTQVYAERDLQKAAEVARQIG